MTAGGELARAAPGIVPGPAAFTRGQVAALTGALAVLVAYVGATVDRAVPQTVALLIIVAVGGVAACNRLAARLGDPTLRRLGGYHLLKIVLVLALLSAGWLPQLDVTSPTYGYDPQRYYFQAQDLAASGFDRSALPALNYTGVLFYYAAVFWTFGHNAVLPALINVAGTLVATLLLVYAAYRAAPGVPGARWTLGLAMLVPEVVWYDAITSRETLCMALITIIALTVAEVFHAPRGERPSTARLVGAVAAFALLGVVRTQMLLLTAAAAGVLFLLPRAGGRRGWVAPAIAAGVVALAVLALPSIASAYFGGYEFSYQQILDLESAAEAAAANAEFTYSSQSVARKLIAYNGVQAVVLAPARVLVTLAAPLPDLSIDVAGLLDGEWAAYQRLTALLSALLFVAIFPLALAATVYAVRSPRREGLPLVATFWVVFVGVAVGSQVIVERYRVTSDLLLVAAAWIGASAPRPVIRGAYAAWLAAVTAGAVFYLTYKELLAPV